ncbi:MAG: SEC-C metal-binding domain-containing protein, partial [Candidatus Omnitrophica bacterium]|nr:SEC-C metal-binding domain-containing protein [Candidatus Omnitrophota bacterium]
AHIVAQAGRYNAVTIATNMAGRGTDIVLGGNAEHLAKSFAENIIKSEAGKESKEKKEEQKNQNEFYKQYLDKFKTQVAEEHEKVVGLGGLHVLGTERHESRRIDNQLRGRCGRQGDPGSSRFYLSLVGIMKTLGMEEGQVIEHPSVSWAIETAQKRVETHNFEIRKQLLEYDNVMNRQREVIYTMRRSILEGEDIKERIVEALEETVKAIVAQYLFSGQEGQEWDIEGLKVCLQTTFGWDISSLQESLGQMVQEQIEVVVYDELLKIYTQKEQAIGVEQMRGLERMILLQTIDFKWKDHLYAMDQLKEGIGLRAFAHRDPLVEYQHEAFGMFESMYHSIMQEAVETVFKVEPLRDHQRVKNIFSSLPQQFVHAEHSSLTGTQPMPDGQEPEMADESMGGPRGRAPSPPPQRRVGEKIGRNDPCPCGSGKKYKKCCGK